METSFPRLSEQCQPVSPKKKKKKFPNPLHPLFSLPLLVGITNLIHIALKFPPSLASFSLGDSHRMCGHPDAAVAPNVRRMRDR